jgi:hypothetical protein
MNARIYEQYSNYIIDRTYQLINSYIDISKYQWLFRERQCHLLNKLRNKCFNMTHHDLINIIIYIDRLWEIPPSLFMNQTNVSYILLAIVILYFKMYDDRWYANSFYADWTRIDIRIINQTESDIFDNISLYIKDKDYYDKKDYLSSIF